MFITCFIEKTRLPILEEEETRIFSTISSSFSREELEQTPYDYLRRKKRKNLKNRKYRKRRTFLSEFRIVSFITLLFMTAMTRALAALI
jgi:hypothetical protein